MSLQMDRKTTGSIVIEKKISQWEDIMKQFSEAHQEKCKNTSLDIPRVLRSIKQFPTGSTYSGTWDVLGMSGFGVYTFPNGVTYQGSFEEGQFHGEGELLYASGEILKGKWKKGVMVERQLIFRDGLKFSEDDWKYCQMPDRRFTVEYDECLRPAGESILTAEIPTRDIPEGYYDTCDGFYDPVTKSVYNPEDMATITRSPAIQEQKWIIDNCRTNPEKALGPRKDLYEEWIKPSLTEPELPPPAAESIYYSGFDESDFDLFIEDELEEKLPFYIPRRSVGSLRTFFPSRQSMMNFIRETSKSKINISNSEEKSKSKTDFTSIKEKSKSDITSLKEKAIKIDCHASSKEQSKSDVSSDRSYSL